MSWAKLDTYWYADEAIEIAGESAGPLVFAAFPVLLAMAKQQNEGGKVKISYRKFAESIFADWEELRPALDALVSGGVLTCPEASDRSATFAFDPDNWERWNETIRKAEERARKASKRKDDSA